MAVTNLVAVAVTVRVIDSVGVRVVITAGVPVRVTVRVIDSVGVRVVITVGVPVSVAVGNCVWVAVCVYMGV